MHTSEQVSVAAHAQLSQPAEAICCMLHLNKTYQMSLSTAKNAHLIQPKSACSALAHLHTDVSC